MNSSSLLRADGRKVVGGGGGYIYYLLFYFIISCNKACSDFFFRWNTDVMIFFVGGWGGVMDYKKSLLLDTATALEEGKGFLKVCSFLRSLGSI